MRSRLPDAPGKKGSWRTARRRDGAIVPYRLEGEGRPLLLIPGLGQSSRLFGTLPRTLARLGFLAIAYDPPGFGKAAAESPPWTLEGAKDDLCAILEAERIPRADLLATSFGGKIALAFAGSKPDRAGSLYLYGSEASGSRRSRSIDRMLALLFRRLEGRELVEATAPLLLGSSFHARKPKVFTDLLRSPAPTEAERIQAIRQLEAVPALDAPALLEEVSAEVFCHAGMEDTLVSPADVRATAEALPRGIFRAIEGAGHSMLLEAPGPCLEALRRPSGDPSPRDAAPLNSRPTRRPSC